MKNQKGVSMITLIITIIVIIILAAIAFIASGDTAGQAQFANYTQAISDLESNFNADPLADIQTEYGPLNRGLTPQQEIWLASAEARELAYDADNSILTGVIVPAGVIFDGTKGGADLTTVLKNADGSANTTVLGKDVACYALEITQIENYEYGQLYGDNLGKESYFVTENGLVFSLPGYQRTVDGEDRFYINDELYYVATSDEANAKRWGEAVYSVDAVLTETTGEVSRTAETGVVATVTNDDKIHANIVNRDPSTTGLTFTPAEG